MKLQLSSDDAAFQQRMRTFFTTEVPQEISRPDRCRASPQPRPERRDAASSQRHTTSRSRHWPAEWGGQDWSPLQRHIWQQEMQLADVPPPLAFNINMVGPVIAQFGSQQQKEQLPPPTANLDIWWCQGFSEPDAGSDLASLQHDRHPRR
ncbi:MAG: acyl-CoA dehydrogenase family protein [Nocardioidaceae bacterium]